MRHTLGGNQKEVARLLCECLFAIQSILAEAAKKYCLRGLLFPSDHESAFYIATIESSTAVHLGEIK